MAAVYLAGGFNKTVALTGAAPPNRAVIFKFEGVDGAKKWWEGGGKKINDEVGVKYADSMCSRSRGSKRSNPNRSE
jgi:hypothetical protein